MNIRYITIERQYGSGGTQIARRVAEQCGIRCYGREILETVAREQNVSVSALEEYEERVSGSLLYSMFVMSQSQTGDPDLLSQEGKLYVAESRVIHELSKNGPAVFVGHCAAHTLGEEDGVLRVFIYGETRDRCRRMIEEYGIAPKDTAAVSHRADHRRAGYYNFCTKKRWNDPENYDLALNSSRLGIDGCAAALCALYQKH